MDQEQAMEALVDCEILLDPENTSAPPDRADALVRILALFEDKDLAHLIADDLGLTLPGGEADEVLLKREQDVQDEEKWRTQYDSE